MKKKISIQLRNFHSELTSSINSKLGYYNLLNKFPLIKDLKIKGSGLTKEAWEARASQEIKNNYRVYKNNKNQLSFINSELPISADESFLGVRIDNGQKN